MPDTTSTHDGAGQPLQPSAVYRIMRFSGYPPREALKGADRYLRGLLARASRRRAS